MNETTEYFLYPSKCSDTGMHYFVEKISRLSPSCFGMWLAHSSFNWTYLYITQLQRDICTHTSSDLHYGQRFFGMIQLIYVQY